MSRRKQSFAEEMLILLAEAPIWVGPVLAAALWAVCRFVAPAMAGPPPTNANTMFAYTLLTTLSKLGPVLAFGVVVLWIGAEWRKFTTRRKYDDLAGHGEISKLSWQEFEQMVGEMFRREGYKVTETGGPSSDGGVDLRLVRGSEVTLVQCKHWKSFNVGVKIVRELLGVVASERATSGVVVTCGHFSKDAVAFARQNPMIELMDGSALANRLPRLQTAQGGDRKRTVGPQLGTAMNAQSRGAHADTAASASGTPACPTCGTAMTLRTSKKGQQPGSQFWGCPKFPSCRGTRQLSQSAAR